MNINTSIASTVQYMRGGIVTLCVLIWLPLFSYGKSSDGRIVLIGQAKNTLSIASWDNIDSRQALSGEGEIVLATAFSSGNNTLYRAEKEGENTVVYSSLWQGGKPLGKKELFRVEGDIAAMAAAGDMLYWYESGSHTLNSINGGDTLSLETLAAGSQEQPIRSIATNGREIYFTQEVIREGLAQSAVYRVNSEGTYKVLLYAGAAREVAAIALYRNTLIIAGDGGLRRINMRGELLASISATLDNVRSIGVVGDELLIGTAAGVFSAACNFSSFDILEPVSSDGESLLAIVPLADNSSAKLSSQSIELRPSRTKVAAGDLLVIDGENMPEVKAVFFGGEQVETHYQPTSSELYVQIPEGATRGGLKVQFTDGSTQTLSSVAVAKKPVLVSFTPEVAAVGSTVIIKGENFGDVEGVFFGGVAAEEYTIVSEGEIHAIPAAHGSGEITLLSAAGADTQEGFELLNTNLEVIRYRTAVVPLSSMEDLEEQNSAVELTLRNNSAQTISFRLAARVNRTPGQSLLFETVPELMPVHQLQPGESMVYTTNDFFRQGALRGRVQGTIEFPTHGRYEICVRVVDAVNPATNIVPLICNQIEPPIAAEPSVVQQRVAQILGFNVVVTEVEVGFHRYYLSGRITNLPSNNFFSFGNDQQPVFVKVPINTSELPLNLPQGANVVPSDGRFELQSTALNVWIYNWIPALFEQPGGIVISQIQPGSRNGLLRPAEGGAVKVDLAALVRRSAGSDVIGNHKILLNSGEMFSAQGNFAPPIAAGGGASINFTRGLRLISEGAQWIVNNRVIDSVALQTIAAEEIRIRTSGGGIATVISMTPQSTIVSFLAETSIQLNQDMVMNLFGEPTLLGTALRYNDGEVLIPVKGSNNPIRLLVTEAVFNNQNELISAKVFLSPQEEISLGGAMFLPAIKEGIIDGEPGDYSILIEGTTRIRHQNLLLWNLPSTITFVGGKDFILGLANGIIPTVTLRAVSVSVEEISYQTSNQRLYIDGQVDVNVRSVEASAGNFIFGANFFWVSQIAFKLDVPDRFEAGGMIGFDERTETWSGGLQFSLAKGKSTFSLEADFSRGPNAWSIALRFSRDPGILLFSKAVISVFLNEVRGLVRFDNSRWTVGIGGTITVQNAPKPGVPRLRFEIDGSVAWGANQHTLLEVSGSAFAEFQTANRELHLGTATIVFNLNTGRIDGRLNSNVDIFGLARFTATGNLLADFDRDMFHIDIEGNINIVNLMNRSGRFVLAKDYTTSLEEETTRLYGIHNVTRFVFRWPSIIRETVQVSNPTFSGVYFRVQNRLVNTSGDFNAIVVSADYNLFVDVAVWAKTNTNLDIAGGVAISGSGNISASVGVGSVRVEASGGGSINGNINLGVSSGRFWFDGSLGVSIAASGSISNCSVSNCNSARFCPGVDDWRPWKWSPPGGGAKICFNRTINLWYNSRGSSAFNFSI